MVDVRPAKDGAHRPPQSAGAVRGQVTSASRRLQPVSTIHTASPVSRATDNLQQQQRGQRQQQQQHLIHPNREPAVSWHLAFAAEVETLTPYGLRAIPTTSTPALRKTDRPQLKSRLKVHLRHLANMGPSENATRPSSISFDGVKTGQEPAEFERPTDLDASSRKWGINMCCEGGVGALSGGGKVAVVGGRSGSFSLRMSYEGRRGAMRDSGLRSAKGRKLYSRW